MIFRMRIVGCLVVGAVAVLSTPSSIAGPLTAETNYTTWVGSVSTKATVDFDTAFPGYTPLGSNSWVTLTADTLTVNGLTFANLLDTQIQKLILSNYNTWNSGTVLKTQPYTLNHVNLLRITFPATGVTAFGIDLIASALSDTYTVTIGADSYTATGFTGRKFYGFTTSTPFNSVDVAYTNNYTNAAIDNVILASSGTQQAPPSSDTPEAASMILCATGLVSLSRFARPRPARS